MPYDLSPKYQPYVPTSEQDVFDFAARHLLTQGVRSYDDERGTCIYRGSDELACPIGLFLANDEVAEGVPVDSLVLGRDGHPGIPRLAPYVRLLSRLQDIHDRHQPLAWRRELQHAAKAYGLSAAVLEEV